MRPLVGWSRVRTPTRTPAIGRPCGSTIEPSTRCDSGISLIATVRPCPLRVESPTCAHADGLAPARGRHHGTLDGDVGRDGHAAIAVGRERTERPAGCPNLDADLGHAGIPVIHHANTKRLGAPRRLRGGIEPAAAIVIAAVTTAGRRQSPGHQRSPRRGARGLASRPWTGRLPCRTTDRHYGETPAMNRGMRTLSIAVLSLIGPAGAAVADPPGLKTLPIGSAAPDFRLPGVDGKTYGLADFAEAKVLVVDLHLQPLPDRPGLRGPDRPAARRYQRQGGRRRGDLAQRPGRRPPRRAGLHRPRRLVRRHEDPRQGPPVRLSRTSTTARPRRPRKAYGVLATPHVFIFDADRKLRYVGPVRRLGGEGGQVARRQERGRRPAGRQAGRRWRRPASSAARPSGPTSRPTPASRWRSGTPSRSRSNRSTSPASPGSPRTTRRSCSLVNLWATWCGPCVAELPELVTMNRMYRGRQLPARHDQPGRSRQAGRCRSGCSRRTTSRRPTTSCSSTDRDKFAEALDQEWPGPVPYTAGDRARRQDPLSQDRRDRPARGQAGHRDLPGTDVLTQPDPTGAAAEGRPRARPWPVAARGSGG